MLWMEVNASQEWISVYVPAVYLHGNALVQGPASMPLYPGKSYYLIFSNDASLIQVGTEVTSAVVMAQFAVSYNFQ